MIKGIVLCSGPEFGDLNLNERWLQDWGLEIAATKLSPNYPYRASLHEEFSQHLPLQSHCPSAIYPQSLMVYRLFATRWGWGWWFVNILVLFSLAALTSAEQTFG
jgi:hypothetical protein